MLERIRKGIMLRNLNEAPAAAKRDPKKIAAKRLGQAIKSAGGRGDFEDSPVDLAEVGRAYYTDSYIRRAVDKHSQLMFKNGWEMVGKNDQAVEYVWTRLKLMAEATGQSIDNFLQEIADNLILYSNSYVVKARAKTGQLPAGVKAVGYSGKQPIAGYFVLPAQLMKVSRDEQGTVLAYQQSSASGAGEGVEFKKEDIVHFTYRKPSGRAYGVPFIYNALEDVRLLRQIEENVARLIYRNLFPLYLYKVGIDKPGYEATDEEIEYVREEIRNIPQDGALVVPERHDIQVVGSEGQAIDANGYLKYFRQRVFSGLGVSDTIMGISDTANRSTSDNQSADLNDSVKDFQKVFADIFKFQIINELLFEGGYDPVLNPDDEVDFVFAEIEFDAKIKRENHVMQLFMQNGITYEEMRQLIGRDTTVDESRLYTNMFSALQSAEAAASQGNNKDQPENQYGKQISPGKPKRSKERLMEYDPLQFQLTESLQEVNLQEALQIDTFTKKIERYWASMAEDVQSRVSKKEEPKTIVAFTLGLFDTLIVNHTKQYTESVFLYGLERGFKEIGKPFHLELGDTNVATTKFRQSFSRFMKDMEKSIYICYEKEDPLSHIQYVFIANQYRIKHIIKTIAYESYNYGIALAGVKNNKTHVYLKHTESSCKQCSSKPKEIVLRDGWRTELPPHHTNCECIVVLTNKEDF